MSITTQKIIAAAICILLPYMIYHIFLKAKPTSPISVNYHFTRRCNYECGFCFHTQKTSHIEPLTRAKKGLALLKRAGMRKVNFAGGEPFLYATMLGHMVDYCKEVLQLESISIVSNGSKITEAWLAAHAKSLDILAISCDSFNEITNVEIGRGTGEHIPQLFQVAEWCRKYGVLFKLNTVICKMNWQEDMNASVVRLDPVRWKCFQVLMVEGENDSAQTLRDVRKFQIADKEFESFCKRHAERKCLVPEPNRLMAKSYLILDEYMRFLDRTGKKPSGCILDVGVKAALESVFWDEEGFKERGGIYDWNKEMLSKTSDGGCGCGEGEQGRDIEDFGRIVKK